MEDDETSPPAKSRSSKRSRTVCHRCHEKKIRCDLKLKSSLPSKISPCSACADSDATCTLRPSHKGRRLKKQVRPSGNTPEQVQQPPSAPDRSDVSDLLSPTSFPAQAVENVNHAADRHSSVPRPTQPIDDIPPVLQQSNLETFFSKGYAWFPIIDLEPDIEAHVDNISPLLQHALALFASRQRDQFIPYATPAEHYCRARELIYHDRAVGALDRIRAAILLHWCSSSAQESSSSPSATDSSSWWAGIAIHLAQDAGLHREPKSTDEEASIKRRIWWTLYARDRLTSFQQGRPSMIDDDFCDVRLPTLADFPSDKEKEAQIFTNWIRLTVIIGRVHKLLFTSRRNGLLIPTVEIASQLTSWINSTHTQIPLPIAKDRTVPFDRDVHLVHLPYLTTISLVYLNTSKSRLPQASVPAVIAASCVARIFEDFLARGSLRFISEQCGWYIAIAILSLLHVRSLTFLQAEAMADISLLRTALKHTAEIWPSARSLDAGIERLLGPSSSLQLHHNLPTTTQEPHASNPYQSSTTANSPSFLEDLCAGDGVQWGRFFPFVTNKTSPLINTILTECRSSFPELWLDPSSTNENWTGQFNDLLETYGSFPLDETFELSASDWDLQL